MPLPALRFIAFIIGVFLITLAVSMVIPMLTLLVYDRSDDLGAFVWSSLIVLCVGLLMVARGVPDTPQLRTRDMYLLTTASWVIVCAFAALPMVFIRHISYTDAFFETMSGITTT
ncbi:potassium transporter TrkH, partial [Pseudomonas sp. BEA3.1]|nr:potassium transporter TrkH [Pseudomonas sp. BEA3.1]